MGVRGGADAHRTYNGLRGNSFAHSKLGAFLLLGDLSRRFPHYDVRTGRSTIQSSAKRKTRLGEWHVGTTCQNLLFAKADQLRLRVGSDDPLLASHWAIMSATKEVS